MTILGAESFNGPVNRADLNAKGYWAGANSLTGAGVNYGAPLEYRSVQRAFATMTNQYPFATASNNDNTPAVFNLGLAQDFYAAGGFWTGISASYLMANPMFMATDGTKMVGVENATFAQGMVAVDPGRWARVTNSAVGTAFTVQTPISYTDGAYYFAGQLGTLVFTWATGTDMPGVFTTTPITTSSVPSLISAIGDFRRSSVGGTAYYMSGASTAGAQNLAKILRSTTGATGSWTAAFTGTGNGSSVTYMYEFGGVLYATGNEFVAGFNRGHVWRSTDGVTWTAAWINTAFAGPVTRRMAYDGANTLVVVGPLGYVASSTDNGVTWAGRVSNTSDNINEVVWTGTEFAAITNTRNTLSSPDGLTWTYKVTAVPTPNLDASQFTFGMKVGTENYVFSQQVYNGLGFHWNKQLKQWDCIRSAEASINSAASNTVPTGVFFGTPAAGSPSTALISGGRSMTGFVLATTGIFATGSDGTGGWGTGRFTFTTESPATSAVNRVDRLEMAGVAVPGQAVPTFDVTWYYNGVAGGPPLRITSVAGQSLFFTTSSIGWNQYYDFVYGNMAGTRNNGVLGSVQIRKRTLSTDVGTPDWQKVPPETATNAIAASGTGSPTTTPSSVTTSLTGDLDEYSGPAFAIPAGYRGVGLKVQATAQRQGIPTPTVALAVNDNGTELPAVSTVLDGATTTLVPLTKLYETTAAGQPWTNGTINASTTVIKNVA